MSLNYLTVLAVLGLTTQAACQNGTYTPPTNCDLSAIRDNANATGVAPFPGVMVDGPNGEIRSDPSSNWSISSTVTDHGDPSGRGTSLRLWLDTSATVGTNESTLPYDTCIIQLGGRPTDRDGCISAGCSEALSEYYRNSARSIARQIGQDGGPTDRFDACHNLVNLQAPDECEDSSSDGSWGSAFSIAPSSLNPDSALNCTPSRPSVPINLGGPGYAPNDTAFAVYDAMLARSIPFVLAFWSNSTTITANGGPAPATPWADSRVGCVRPDTMRVGSRALTVTSGVGMVGGPGRRSFAIRAVASLALVLITSRCLF
ncbi:hypothetical protein EPUS_08416 [Endocarpon pusillum Z07020]|uniref:Uncharacterized protein n=1 Tax=Endocarpon pusillum (strain Z07020 / HMAS-L-300199) TaxID=1263415 RepID=U1G3Z1_ENDPU|nr:uncharacterized protein EPUS_08416 [Endocarpon pusillum Z07020]ERF72022.1 hypothetical protein EPUS_08416 [Endocarpon pusillum Z07020]